MKMQISQNHIAKMLFIFASVIFNCNAVNAQTYNVLYSLGSHANDPLNPAAIGLISQGRDGRLYTSAQLGGSHNSGEAFAFTPAGALGDLFDFSPYPNPVSPWSGLTMGTDGNFYGTTTSGGTHGVGTVFKVPASGGSMTVLWNFTGGTDEGTPESSLALGLDGNFYGTTAGVYAGTYGTAFKITPKGVLTTIHPFKFTDGATPYGLILGLDGNFYGVARGGGANSLGVVFRMSKAGVVKVLHSFAGYPTDGANPVGTLAQANDGTLYGTTYLGGSGKAGTVFKISPTGTGYAVLHHFDRTININDGVQPLAGMAYGTDGNLYGTASLGGHNNGGALFKITPGGTYSTVYSLCSVAGCTDGLSPQTAMVQHTSGKLYGETRGNSLGGGVLFSLNAGLGPFASLVLWQGKVGASIQILGQGFTGTTSVKVGGTTAPFSVVSDTYLTATVPAGTSGLVTVTTPGGTLTSTHKYVVLPTITGFSPSGGGPVGSSAIITGKGLIQTTKVTFGSKVASFVVNSDTQITAIVPTGAVTAKISITTPGGKASSPTAFTVF
jgi:uncharacterized repeat protein (TIGR03803 family)